MRIGLRLLIGFFLILGLATAVVLRVFVEEVKPGTRLAMEDALVDAAYGFAQLAVPDMKAGRIATGTFAQALQQRPWAEPNANISGFKKSSVEYRITITDSNGIVVFDTAGEAVGQDFSRWNDVYLTLRGRYGARSTLSDPSDPTSSVMHVAAPVKDGDRMLGVLTVSKPTLTLRPYIERSQQRILRWSWLLLGLSLLIGLAFSWWIARSLSRLQRYALAVTRGERMAAPVMGRYSGHTEFTDLAQSVHTMRLKLEDKAYVENYVHTLTHELKSPLTGIQAAAELLQGDLPAADRERFGQRITQQTQRLRQLIDQLLALAAVEQLQQVAHPAPVDLTALAQDAVAQLEPRWTRKHLSVSVHTAPDAAGLQVQADAFLLRQAVGNLLDNAIDFAPTGSTIDVQVQRDGPRAVLRVRDHGPGIPDYAQARIFERFYSLTRPTTGEKSSGLGLCMVREVAQLHHGHIELRNRTEAHGSVTGCDATLTLPLG